MTTKVANSPTKPISLARHADMHAREIRTSIGIDNEEPFDPRDYCHELGLVIVTPAEIPGLSDDDVDWASQVDPRVWSGVGVPLPNGRLVVILHPNQSNERAAVTILEEVAHRYFHHAPSRIIRLPNGAVKREFTKEAEDEAYWTAAAVLVPSRSLATRVWQGKGADLIADEFGVSRQLVEFRLKTLGLWRAYRKYAA